MPNLVLLLGAVVIFVAIYIYWRLCVYSFLNKYKAYDFVLISVVIFIVLGRLSFILQYPWLFPSLGRMLFIFDGGFDYTLITISPFWTLLFVSFNLEINKNWINNAFMMLLSGLVLTEAIFMVWFFKSLYEQKPIDLSLYEISVLSVSTFMIFIILYLKRRIKNTYNLALISSVCILLVSSTGTAVHFLQIRDGNIGIWLYGILAAATLLPFVYIYENKSKNKNQRDW